MSARSEVGVLTYFTTSNSLRKDLLLAEALTDGQHMAFNSIRFLPPLEPKVVRQREAELRQAEARSHAAIISYARSRKRRPRVHTTKVSQEKGPGGKDVAIDKTERTLPRDGQVSPRPPKLLLSVETGGLDPFLKVADDLSRADRAKLHACGLASTLTARYDCANDADLTTNTKKVRQKVQEPVFCPIRDMIVPKLALCRTMVQCLMLISELSMHASDMLIHLRRSLIINELKATLCVKEIFLCESTAVTLASLMVAESRAGDFRAARSHAAGLLAWVRARGGLENIQNLGFFTGVGTFETLVYFDFDLFRTREELDRALARMNLPSGHVVASLSKYFYADDFGPQLAVLHLMNSLVERDIAGFIPELERVALHSGEFGPGSMLYMIADSARKVGHWQGKDCAVRSWETIEFVRLLSFAKMKFRLAVATMLAARLSGSHSEAVNLEAVKQEITAGWQERKDGLVFQLDGGGMAVARSKPGSPTGNIPKKQCPWRSQNRRDASPEEQIVFCQPPKLRCPFKAY